MLERDTTEAILDSLDFSCEGMRPTEQETGHMRRAGEERFAIFVGRKRIGTAPSEDLAKARALHHHGTWSKVAA